MKNIEIQSERLIIKEHIEDDLFEYHQLISDDKNMYFLPGLKTTSIEETRSLLHQIISDSEKDESRKTYYFGIFLKDNTYIGDIGYSVSSKDLQNRKKVNLGFFIKNEFWNRGLTTEAVYTVVDFAFKKNDVVKIETGCLVDNKASEKIMIKCGFKMEAYKKRHYWLYSQWMDRVEYGITKEEFLSHPAGDKT